MKVIKRDGTFEKLSFDKILSRIELLSKDLQISADTITQQVITRIYDEIRTTELDELAAQLCSSMIIDHSDYGILASRIIISNHHKSTSPSFSETIYILYNNKDIHGEKNPLVSEDLYRTVMNHKDKLNSYIKYDRDYDFDYFGFKTLEKSYLIRVKGKIVERPQHLFMRVSLGIHGEDFKDALETYDYMSKQYFTHATPTLYNAGTNRPSLSSCFLLDVHDSVEGMYDLAKECAIISKNAGGIGINIHDIRSKNSIVRGTNGRSSGIIPMLRVFNAIGRHIDQCFIPETIIYTENGPKQICEVTTEDKVVTIDGTFKKINKIITNNVKKDILDIRTSRSFESISVTKEHQLYVLRGQKKMTNFNDIKRRLDAKTIHGEFISAKDLKDDDLVAYPEINLLNADQTINEDLAKYYRMVGIMLGDGHITEKKNEAGITVNKDGKIKTYNFIKEFLELNKIHYWESLQKNCIQIRWSNNNNFNLKREDIYDSNKEKYINAKFMKLNKYYTKQLIKGLIETDGCITGEISFCTTSYNLAHSIRYLLLKIGIVSSGCIKDYRGKTHEIRPGEFITNKKISYYIRIPKVKELTNLLEIGEGKFLKSFTHNGKIWSRIISVNERYYEGDVYDLNIEDNHNYVVGSFGLVHNSGRRPGSIAVFIEPHHADIMQFLDLRKNHGNEEERCRDLFLALWISDLFMKRVQENGIWSLMDPDECRGLSTIYGEEFEKLYIKYENEGKFRKQIKAQEIWYKIIENQIETGTPYISYKDAVNYKSNQKNLGVIKSSNLCVSSETMIYTDKGYYPIIDLEDKNIKVWNGTEFSSTIVKKTGENQKLINIYFNNGMSIKCTLYHKFYIETGSRPADKSRVKIIEAKDLEPKMKIIRYNLPTLNNSTLKMKSPYTHGFFCADGTYYQCKTQQKQKCQYSKWNNTDFCKKHQFFKNIYNSETECCAESGEKQPIIYLYHSKRELLKYIDYEYSNENEKEKRLTLSLHHDIEDKFFVPINYCNNTKLRWLEGYLDGDGCVVKFNGIKNIQVSSIEKEFLTNVFYMLQTLGVNSVISVSYNERFTSLPDGKGGKKDYLCKKTYRLNIDAISLIHLKELGFNPKRLDITDCRKPHHKTNRFIQVTKIEDNEEYEDTYCFNEPLKNRGIFNGILTGQCNEINLYTNYKDEIGVCNLASICLPKYISDDGTYNHKELHKIAKILTKNLNKVIDVNYYPLEKAKTSNFRHRPIGIGVQGLACTFALLKMAFDSEEARKLNKEIFETIYHGALEASMEIAKKRKEWYNVSSYNNEFMNNYTPLEEFEDPYKVAEKLKMIDEEKQKLPPQYIGAYSSFVGSPTSEGLLQFDLWGVTPSSGRYNWDALKKDIKEHGLRNSLLMAVMPTASTASIMGNNEGAEAFNSMIYKRRVLSGEFIMVNKYLRKDLEALNLWSKELSNKIIMNNGSIQNIPEIPDDIKKIYKIVWEIPQRAVIDQYVDRGAYICQTQSMNLFFDIPDYKRLTSAHFYGWKKGLKTGIYYCRSRTVAKTQLFTIEPEKQVKEESKEEDQEGCLSCGA